MSYVSLISVTQAEFNALKTAGGALDRPVAFFITDAAIGSPNIIFGRQGQTATVAETAGAVSAGSSAAGGGLRQWEASKAYAQGNIVVVATAVGTLGIGDLIIRNSAGTSGATFDATEAGLWTEVANDPDVMGLAGAQTVTGIKTFSALPVLSGDATTASQPVRKSQFDNALAGKMKASRRSAAEAFTAGSGNGTAPTTLVVTNGSVTYPYTTPVGSVIGLAVGDGWTENGEQLSISAINVLAGTVTVIGGTFFHPGGTYTLNIFGSGVRVSSFEDIPQSEIAGLVTDLAGKQATLISGTNIKTVNGASVVGGGNVAIAADLPGGTATTVINEGIATTGAPTIDTTTVPGETIIRWTASGSFTVPIGIASVRALVVGAGGGGGGACGRGGFSGGSGVIVIRFSTQTRTYQVLSSFADNAAARAAGILVGQFFKKTADGSVQQAV